MKKMLLPVAFGLIAITPVAFASYRDAEAAASVADKRAQHLRDIEDAMAKDAADDAALKDAFDRLTKQLLFMGSVDGRNKGSITVMEGVKTACQKAGISAERMTMVLEEMVREKLSAIETDEANSVRWNTTVLMPAFGAFPDYDASQVFKECFLSKSEAVRINSMEIYVDITGVKSIPLLQDVFKTKHLSNNHRNRLYAHLEKASAKLKEENKTNDAETFNAFILEMRQKEKP